MNRAINSSLLPTPALETWKYTNLPRAMPQGLKIQSSDPVVIRRSRGLCDGEVQDIIWTGEEGFHHTPSLCVIMEENAELTLIERHNGQGAYWKNMVTEITLGDGARLNHIRLQTDGPDAVHTNMAHITLGRDAVYEGFALNMGAKLSRHEIQAVISGTGSHASFNGMNLLDGARHGDTTILIEHTAPNCTSNQFYRSLLDDQSRGVFQGKVHVHQAAQRTDAYQLSNAILLSPKAEMDTKPELEIYADDVKCSHGATTGNLDETPLFYLRSRGLSEREARLLLLQSFLDELVDKIDAARVQEDVRNKAHVWMNHRFSAS